MSWRSAPCNIWLFSTDTTSIWKQQVLELWVEGKLFKSFSCLTLRVIRRNDDPAVVGSAFPVTSGQNRIASISGSEDLQIRRCTALTKTKEEMKYDRSLRRTSELVKLSVFLCCKNLLFGLILADQWFYIFRVSLYICTPIGCFIASLVYINSVIFRQGYGGRYYSTFIEFFLQR